MPCGTRIHLSLQLAEGRFGSLAVRGKCKGRLENTSNTPECGSGCLRIAGIMRPAQARSQQPGGQNNHRSLRTPDLEPP